MQNQRSEVYLQTIVLSQWEHKCQILHYQKLDSYQDAPQQAINYVILSSNEYSFFTLRNKMEFWIITNDQKQMINCCNRNLDLAGCHKIYFNLTHFYCVNISAHKNMHFSSCKSRY